MLKKEPARERRENGWLVELGLEGILKGFSLSLLKENDLCSPDLILPILDDPEVETVELLRFCSGGAMFLGPRVPPLRGRVDDLSGMYILKIVFTRVSYCFTQSHILGVSITVFVGERSHVLILCFSLLLLLEDHLIIITDATV